MFCCIGANDSCMLKYIFGGELGNSDETLGTTTGVAVMFQAKINNTAGVMPAGLVISAIVNFAE